MIIVAGGDSFVWGSELSDSLHGGFNGYSRKTFAALLAGNDYVCAAYPGIGNKEIADRVKENVVENCGVLVSWTWPTRDNTIDSDNIIFDLQQFLIEQDIPYMFTCADNCVVTGNKDIDWAKWFLFPVIPNSGWHANEQPRGFYQWALENKYELAPVDKHPLDQAHIDASQLMEEQFNELVTKYHQSC